ncbi:TPA_asm: hypothetical protein GB144_05865 [Salmonella enterica subsp. enterica]|nr:hypothetical protein [Salmonella enterica subsp. enterica]
MNELKKELGLVQGVILLTTSLLGTGVFALPELAALAAGDISLWAWPLLIILIFPVKSLKSIPSAIRGSSRRSATRCSYRLTSPLTMRRTSRC